MKEGESGAPTEPRRPTITAARARRLARQDLARRLEGLLIETGGNVAEVARRLGKDRSTVRYHLGRLGMLHDEGPPPDRDAGPRPRRDGGAPPRGGEGD